ncbi:MAG TPA: EF2563 family selenium-dependent molybdenum hydroxylase system protein [Candidatus Fimousia stercorigallinarum]|nr:EF2563 family selenium-dependent molybdenum hydroxylase system protein [Candidatus Fimousia stercorigallinarum]
MTKEWIVVRGGGDLATGTIYKLWKSGLKVLILECQYPSSIRRKVAFSDAVYNGSQTVEDVTCHLVQNLEEAEQAVLDGCVPLMVDPEGDVIRICRPTVVVDAILAKRNLGTKKDMAPMTIALGPGFEAGKDVHYVIETKRGHRLGRIITEGCAIPNTGIPGVIAGYGKERVMHSPEEGIFHEIHHIGDEVEKGDVIGWIEHGNERVDVTASLTGILRGIIREGYPVTKGFKIADIDPRMEEKDNCDTISDKARCIAGGVLEAILYSAHMTFTQK